MNFDDGLSLLHAEGGWYGVVQVPAVVPEDELMLSLLLDHRVLVQPGYFFDFDRESFLVISLLASETNLTDGVSRDLDHFPLNDLSRQLLNA